MHVYAQIHATYVGEDVESAPMLECREGVSVERKLDPLAEACGDD